MAPDVCSLLLLLFTIFSLQPPVSSFSFLHLPIDAKCKPGADNWVCKRENDCPDLEQQMREEGKPDICGFPNNQPVFCCRLRTSWSSSNTRPTNGIWQPSQQQSFQNTQPSSQFQQNPFFQSRPVLPQKPVTFQTQPLGLQQNPFMQNMPWQQTTQRPQSNLWGPRPPVQNQWSPQPQRPFVPNPIQTNTNYQVTEAPDISVRGRKSEEMCKEYSKYVFIEIEPPVVLGVGGGQSVEKLDMCVGAEEALIVGGTDALPREFPHMAQIGYEKTRGSISWLCGGTLISPRFVLSAAHCSHYSSRVHAKWVKLGEYDTDTEEDESQLVIVRIVQIIDHPKYTKKRKTDDIALFKLEKDIGFSSFIRPACLYTKPEDGRLFENNRLLASGWGNTEFGGRMSNILQKVKLSLIDVDECNSTYNGVIRGDVMVCARNQGRGDTCQGDSGGPLQVKLQEPYCMYSVVGVTSFGRKCGVQAGVYTKVSAYVDWIEGIVWP